MRTGPISQGHVEALERIVPAFEEAGIWYRATGGLAGNLHGSAWPLHDIDLDYLRSDWPLIEACLSPHILSSPTLYEDEEFKLVMAKARIGMVDIELCQLEDCFIAGAKGWHLLDPDRETRVRRTWQHLTLWSLPLEDLIYYKEIIGRAVDLDDLRSLVSAQDFS